MGDFENVYSDDSNSPTCAAKQGKKIVDNHFEDLFENGHDADIFQRLGNKFR